MDKFLFQCLSLTIISLIFPGCRYQAGYPIAQTHIRSIYVAPAVNDAIVAQMSGILSRQIRTEITHSGIAVLDSETGSDAILETTIEKYGRSIGTVDEYDTDTAKTLSLSVTIRCSLKNNHSGEYLFKDRTLSANLSINATDTAQAIEYQKLPQLSHKVAQKLVMLIAMTDKNTPHATEINTIAKH